MIPAAAWPAAGAVASAAISAVGGKGAAKTQAETADKALAYQRSVDAERYATWSQAMMDYQQKWNAWNANREMLLRRYGVDVAPFRATTAWGTVPRGAGAAHYRQPVPSGTPTGDYAVPRGAGTPSRGPITGQTMADIIRSDPESVFDWDTAVRRLA